MKCPHCNGTGAIVAGLGDQVLAARRAKNLTQAELANRAGLGRAQIANIEAGRTDVPTKTLIRIADALGVRAGDLLP